MAAINTKQVLTLVLTVAWTAMLGAGEAPNESQDLPGVPKGVRLGMDVDTLMKVRPQAEPFDLDVALGEKPAPSPRDMGQGAHQLVEKLEEKGSRFSVAMYDIDDGRCVGFGVVYNRPWKDLVVERGKMIGRLRNLLGKNYERHLLRKGFSGVTYLAPVFLWKGEDRTVALTVTSTYPGVAFERGIIQLNVWKTGSEYESALKSFFVTDVDQVLLSALFEPLEKEAPKAAELPEKPAASRESEESDRSAPRWAELDQDIRGLRSLYTGKQTLWDRLEERGKQLLAKYSAPEERVVIYCELAIMESAPAGTVRPEKAVEYVQEGLKIPLPRAKHWLTRDAKGERAPLPLGRRLRLHVIWGDVVRRTGGNKEESLKEAAGHYLDGIKELVPYDLPEKPPEMVLELWYDGDGSPEVKEALARESAQRRAHNEKAELQEGLIRIRDLMVERIVHLYWGIPNAIAELEAMAKTKIADDPMCTLVLKQIEKGLTAPKKPDVRFSDVVWR